MGVIAYADESMRASAIPPMYLIAATIVEADTNLSELEAILPKGATKLHWRDLGQHDQKSSLNKIAAIESWSAITVAIPTDPRKQERARRKALEALLPLLEAQDVEEVVMESRLPSLDAKDRVLFRSMVKKKAISTIRISFGNPSTEHRLWLPDQILGAYAESRIEPDAFHPWANEWKRIEPSIQVIEIAP